MLKLPFLARSIVAIIAIHSPAIAATLWYQDFDSATALADLVGSDPNQTDGLTSSGSGVIWSLSDGSLATTRTGNAGSLTINGDDFGAPYLQVEMRFQIQSVTSGETTALMFALGSGFTTGNVHPANSDTHSDFSINLTSTTSFRFRDHDNDSNLGTAADGTDAIANGEWIDIWWGINNSGASIGYGRPDGTAATLAHDRWDLWAKIGGTWFQIGNNPANTDNIGGTLDDFKITFTRGSGTVLFDSIRISDTIDVVPEPAAVALAISGCALIPFRRRRD